MAVTIRLSRHGAKKRPFYRIVVTNTRSPRDGRYIEAVGTYDPAFKPEKLVVEQEKIAAWIEKGARPSDTVRTLLKRAGISTKKAAPAPAAA